MVRERALAALDSGLFPNEQQQPDVLSWLHSSERNNEKKGKKETGTNAQQTDEQRLRALATQRAQEIEGALAQLYPACDRNFKSQFRSMQFNLKDDRNNPKLRVRVLTGQLAAADLCRMTSTQMASEEMVEFRKEVQAKAVENAVLQKEEMDFIIKKTHKGEEIVQQPRNTGAVATSTESWLAINTPSRSSFTRSADRSPSSAGHSGKHTHTHPPDSGSPHSLDRSRAHTPDPTSAAHTPDRSTQQQQHPHRRDGGAGSSTPMDQSADHHPLSVFLQQQQQEGSHVSGETRAAPNAAQRQKLEDEQSLAHLRVQSFDAFSGDPDSSDDEDAPQLPMQEQQLDVHTLDALKPDLLSADEHDVSDTFGAVLWEGVFVLCVCCGMCVGCDVCVRVFVPCCLTL
jgi:Transcription factor S-II (TFIIS), central domain